ncbi:MAG: hypothetical protein SGBAC_007733 [Bacillariaceae sp.]
MSRPQKEESSSNDKNMEQKFTEVVDDSHRFPTLPAFTVPVEVRSTPQYGPTEFGVFALEDIPAGHRDFWVWTHRVQKIHHTKLKDYIQSNFESTNIRQIRQFLRRGFILPPPKDDCWNSNPTDAGSFMNHNSTNPNCGQPYGTLRTIKKGEELTMDYSHNGNPKWYQDICHKYGILTGVEIALREKHNDGQIQHASFDPPEGFPAY